MKAIGKILKALFYFFVFLVFYNMVDLYLCHMSRDFTNFEHSIFSSNGNAPEEIRSEIFESLHISDDGRPLSEPDKIDTFVEKHFSRDDILMLGTCTGEVITGFDAAKQFKKGDIDFLKNVTFDINGAYVSMHGDVAWLSMTGYFRTMIEGLILPLRNNVIMVQEGDLWKLHKSQTDWFYNTNFLLNKIVFSVIFTFICIFLLVLRIIIAAISWKQTQKSADAGFGK